MTGDLSPVEDAAELGDGAADGVDGRGGVDVHLAVDDPDEALGDVRGRVGPRAVLAIVVVVLMVRVEEVGVLGAGAGDGRRRRAAAAGPFHASLLHPAA